MAKLQIKQLNSTKLIACNEQQQMSIIGSYRKQKAYVNNPNLRDRLGTSERQEYLWKGYAEGDFSIEVNTHDTSSISSDEFIDFYDVRDNEVGYIEL